MTVSKGAIRHKKELHKQVTTRSLPMNLLPINRGSHENEVRAQQVFYQREGDGSSFINHHEFSLAQFHGISRVYVLQGAKQHFTEGNR